MNEQRLFGVLFLIFLSITILLFTLIFISDNYFQISTIFMVICLTISIVYLRKHLIEIQYVLKSDKEKQKNIRDIYLYHQLLDPPKNNN